MRTVLLVLLAAAAEQSCTAAFEREAEGARTAALGGAGLALRGDPWGTLTNPGLSMRTQALAFGIVHAPSPFGLRELSRSGFLLVESFVFGSVAASGSRFGFDLYRELSFRLSFGTDIAPGLRAGAALNYYRLAIPDYGSASTFGGDLGLVWEASDDVAVGLSATNVNAPAIGRSKEKLPQTFGAGSAYAPFPGLILLLDLVKDIRFPLELRFGVEYSPLEALALRAGAGRDPSTFGCGVGVTLDPATVDYSFTRHEALGFTHRIGLTLRLEHA